MSIKRKRSDTGARSSIKEFYSDLLITPTIEEEARLASICTSYAGRNRHRMKRLLERLRMWLIVKLGGYTIQKVLNYRQIKICVRRDTLLVRAEAKVNFELLEKDRFRVWEGIKRELAYRLATELLRRDAVLFTARQQEQQETERCVIVRADIEAVKGKTLAWGMDAKVGSL